jgi:hypothetical protein
MTTPMASAERINAPSRSFPRLARQDVLLVEIGFEAARVEGVDEPVGEGGILRE